MNIQLGGFTRMDKLEWQDLASQLGLEYDEDTKIIFGQKDGYTLFIEDAGEKSTEFAFQLKVMKHFPLQKI